MWLEARVGRAARLQQAMDAAVWMPDGVTLPAMVVLMVALLQAWLLQTKNSLAYAAPPPQSRRQVSLQDASMARIRMRLAVLALAVAIWATSASAALTFGGKSGPSWTELCVVPHQRSRG